MKRLISSLVLALFVYAAAAHDPCHKTTAHTDLVPDVLLTCPNPVESQVKTQFANLDKTTSVVLVESTGSHEIEIAHAAVRETEHTASVCEAVKAIDKNTDSNFQM